MPLSPGTKLGPYEILAPIGAGGMGEVYRARDSRLARDVALKVLPESFAADAGRRQRFETEARALAALNHPNIVAVFDFGGADGAPYLVSELLQGQTIEGLPVSPRKAIEYAAQIAQGLAAAHAKGIAHRDLKPANIFLTAEGRIKILDFGLAKQIVPAATMPDETATAVTQAGAVMGTAGYMSPEQVRGEAADARSDIFSFGVVLYELLTGKRAFPGETSVESMHAILKSDPPEIKSTSPEISPALEQVVRRCMEKSPQERYQSMRDVMYILQLISGLLSEVHPAVKSAGRRRWWPGALALAAGIGFAAAELLHLTVWTTKPLNYPRFTVRQGPITAARFVPGGRSAIYGAAWNGEPYRLFTEKPGDRNTPVALALPNANLLAVSRTGQMAVALDYRQSTSTFFGSGTLARVPLEGGSPRELAENVSAADWSPDGESLAIVRNLNGKRQLEFPLGKVIYTSSGGIDSPRISPDARQIAFFEQPILGDNSASLMLAGLDGRAKALTQLRDQSGGIVWRSRSEIWFTAAGNLNAISTGGSERLVARFPGSAYLQDLASDGTALLMIDTLHAGVAGKGPKDTAERDMTWLSRSRPDALSPDGELLLFSETGAPYSVYVRKSDGSPPVLLGDQNGISISPDKKWAFAKEPFSPKTFFLPIGPGETKEARVLNGVWTGPSEFLFNEGTQPNVRVKIDGFRDGALAGKPRAVTPEGFSFASEVHDGSFICRNADGSPYVCSISGAAPRKLPGLTAGDNIRGWSTDGRSVFAAPRGRAFPMSVDRVNLETGKRERWKDIQPFEVSGLVRVSAPVIAMDGQVYFYSYRRRFSELFLVEGLR